MKWILLLLLLISCQDEDMRLFQSSLTNEGGSPPIVKTDFTIIMSGQSIPQGEYPINQSGYSDAKINNPSATFLECKTAVHTWEPLSYDMISPYQFTAYPNASWGCSMEYTLAEYFSNDNKTINFYKPAWGAQKFGTDADPGYFNVRADFTPRGIIAKDIDEILAEQKANGITFDFMLWAHGESDGRDALDSRNAYEMNLRRFITMVRNIYPDLPFLIRQLPPETEEWMGAVIPGGRDAINTAFNNIIADTPNCYLVVMPDPFSQGDLIHPSNPTGNDQMALAYWEVLQTLF